MAGKLAKRGVEGGNFTVRETGGTVRSINGIRWGGGEGGSATPAS